MHAPHQVRLMIVVYICVILPYSSAVGYLQVAFIAACCCDPIEIREETITLLLLSGSFLSIWVCLLTGLGGCV